MPEILLLIPERAKIQTHKLNLKAHPTLCILEKKSSFSLQWLQRLIYFSNILHYFPYKDYIILLNIKLDEKPQNFNWTHSQAEYAIWHQFPVSALIDCLQVCLPTILPISANSFHFYHPGVGSIFPALEPRLALAFFF